ncbi:hypothetical protein HDU76_007235 [Blyttiomyces sp. JEL0837]|nr:hypothetical protein HDU76_007235 [Blyttiomyces sp. JEL0837]
MLSTSIKTVPYSLFSTQCKTSAWRNIIKCNGRFNNFRQSLSTTATSPLGNLQTIEDPSASSTPTTDRNEPYQVPTQKKASSTTESPSQSPQSSHLFPLVAIWGRLFLSSQKGKPVTSPTTDDLTFLAKSLNQDPEHFSKEFLPVYEYWRRSKVFTREEDMMILKLVEAERVAGNNERIEFDKLKTTLNRSSEHIHARYQELVKLGIKLKKPKTAEKGLQSRPKTGVAISFANHEEEQAFINNMLRTMKPNGFVEMRPLHKRFYPQLDFANVAATVGELKLKYTAEQLLEMRAKVCKEEDNQMKTL